MDLELIKTEIAQKDGFDTWSQMVECFCTTEPGRRVIDKNVTDLVRRAVAYSTGKRQSNIPDVKASFSNKYGFLYWCENDTTADDGRCKWIEASTLDEACEKFLKKAPKTLRQVDYEVQLGDKYIDISERADFQNWI